MNGSSVSCQGDEMLVSGVCTSVTGMVETNVGYDDAGTTVLCAQAGPPRAGGASLVFAQARCCKVVP